MTLCPPATAQADLGNRVPAGPAQAPQVAPGGAHGGHSGRPRRLTGRPGAATAAPPATPRSAPAASGPLGSPACTLAAVPGLHGGCPPARAFPGRWPLVLTRRSLTSARPLAAVTQLPPRAGGHPAPGRAGRGAGPGRPAGRARPPRRGTEPRHARPVGRPPRLRGRGSTAPRLPPAPRHGTRRSQRPGRPQRRSPRAAPRGQAARPGPQQPRRRRGELAARERPTPPLRALGTAPGRGRPPLPGRGPATPGGAGPSRPGSASHFLPARQGGPPADVSTPAHWPRPPGRAGPGRGRGRAAGGGGGPAGGQLRSPGERLWRGRRPRSQGRMEAEGRVPGPPLPPPSPGSGGGAGARADAPAGAPGAARGPPLTAAAAEVLSLDDEEDDLEVFSKDTSLAEVNLFSPSMPISPSSMINQYKIEDEPELRDLFITVDDPESHITTIETFITYRVVTKTSRGEFDTSEYEVRRRYQDFLWLKSKLEEAHPTLIIPPLPEKFIMKGMVERFSDEFIETRRKALHKFLNRIADHPTLTFNEDFKVFLTAQAWELSSHKKQGPSLLSRMGQTVRAVASSVRGGVKNRPEMFTEMNNYMETFSQKINVLDKIAHRIYKEEREYFNEMKEYGPIHTLWSASEEDIADSLKGVASCIDKCCKATEKRMAGLSENLLPILHEYVLYSEILMGVLKRRDQIQGELDSKVDALANKKTEKDLFSEEIGKLEDKVECANNALKADWDRWKQNMQCDMRSTFTNVAENNLRYYEECLATWESFLASQTVDLHVEADSEDRP